MAVLFNKKIQRFSLLFVILALASYVIIRAYHLSFTHDESLSYTLFPQENSYYKTTANNHFLNTWAMALFYHLLGAKEFYLRLPNVLAFILYAFFAYKILIKAQSFPLMLIGSVLLLLNPFLIDYFSIARGYGLALAFELGSIYFLLESLQFENHRKYITLISLSLFFSLLAAYANLIYLNLNIILLFIFSCDVFILFKKNLFQFNIKRIVVILCIILINIIGAYFLFDHLLMLRNNNELYAGGSSNFIDDSLTSLIFGSIYFSQYGEETWMKAQQVVISIFLLSIIYQFYKTKQSQFSKILLLLILMIFTSILQHYILNALYPTYRMALLFIPLFALTVYYLFSEVFIELKTYKYLSYILNLSLVCISIPLIWNFISNMNITYTYEWKYDAHTKNIMTLIQKEQSQHRFAEKNITVSNHWLFEPTMNYYRDVYSMNYLPQLNRSGVDTTSSYIYYLSNEHGKIITDSCYDVIEAKDQAILLARKNNCHP